MIDILLLVGVAQAQTPQVRPYSTKDQEDWSALDSCNELPRQSGEIIWLAQGKASKDTDVLDRNRHRGSQAVSHEELAQAMLDCYHAGYATSPKKGLSVLSVDTRDALVSSAGYLCQDTAICPRLRSRIAELDRNAFQGKSRPDPLNWVVEEYELPADFLQTLKREKEQLRGQVKKEADKNLQLEGVIDDKQARIDELTEQLIDKARYDWELDKGTWWAAARFGATSRVGQPAPVAGLEVGVGGAHQVGGILSYHPKAKLTDLGLGYDMDREVEAMLAYWRSGTHWRYGLLAGGYNRAYTEEGGDPLDPTWGLTLGAEGLLPQIHLRKDWPMHLSTALRVTLDLLPDRVWYASDYTGNVPGITIELVGHLRYAKDNGQATAHRIAATTN